MENKKLTVIVLTVAVVAAIILAVGVATHWFSMGVGEHMQMDEPQKISMLYVV